MTLDPQNPRVLAASAVVLVTFDRDRREVERLLRKAIEIEPGNANRIAYLAAILWQDRGRAEEADLLYRKAIEIDPKDGDIMANFATFMWRCRGSHDEAEQLYKEAIKLSPKSAYVLNGYANFMEQERREHETAERLYREALELDPRATGINGHYAGLLLARGRLAEAVEKLDKATSLNKGNVKQLTAELALYRGILAKLMRQNDMQAIDEMRQLLSTGFTRFPWNFDAVLEIAREKLSSEDYTLYAGLAAAILDPEKVPSAEVLFQERATAEAAAKDAKDQVAPGPDSTPAHPSTAAAAQSTDTTTVT